MIVGDLLAADYISLQSDSRVFWLISGVLLVVPLNLAITPMRVLEDPLYGQECRAMFEEGEVDDRFLIILFLTVERLRKNSPWKPYVLNLHCIFMLTCTYSLSDCSCNLILLKWLP